MTAEDTEHPTFIRADGTKEWRDADGKLHRPDGPAVIWADGTEEYWLHGERHREDGPAVINPDGSEEHWINGVRQDK